MKGLTKNSIKSEYKIVKNLNELSEIKNYIKSNGYIVVYLDNEVLFGRYQDEDFLFYDDRKIELKYVKRMRVFNEKEELHIWRNKGVFKGRYRCDSKEDGEEIDIVDAIQVVIGTKSESIGENFTRLFETNGSEIILPGQWVVSNKEKRVAVKVRYYIEYLNGYQASYSDNRFLSFEQLGG